MHRFFRLALLRDCDFCIYDIAAFHSYALSFLSSWSTAPQCSLFLRCPVARSGRACPEVQPKESMHFCVSVQLSLEIAFSYVSLISVNIMETTEGRRKRRRASKPSLTTNQETNEMHRSLRSAQERLAKSKSIQALRSRMTEGIGHSSNETLINVPNAKKSQVLRTGSPLRPPSYVGRTPVGMTGGE